MILKLQSFTGRTQLAPAGHVRTLGTAGEAGLARQAGRPAPRRYRRKLFIANLAVVSSNSTGTSACERMRSLVCMCVCVLLCARVREGKPPPSVYDCDMKGIEFATVSGATQWLKEVRVRAAVLFLLRVTPTHAYTHMR